jgi:DNA-binding IclR family transcriptional regulator
MPKTLTVAGLREFRSGATNTAMISNRDHAKLTQRSHGAASHLARIGPRREPHRSALCRALGRRLPQEETGNTLERR